MKKNRFWHLTIALIFACFASKAAAQTPSITGHSYWGFDLGVTGSAYEGNQNYFWYAEDPNFIDPFTLNPANDIRAYVPFNDMGSGGGFVVGGKIAFPLSQSLDVEGKLRYLTNFTSKNETDNVILAEDPSTHQSIVTSNAANSYSLLLSNLSLSALVNLRLSSLFYGIGGFEISTLLSNSASISQRLTDPATYYYYGTGDQSNVDSIYHTTSSLSSFFSSTRVAFQIGAGAAFGLSEASSTMLDLEFLFSIPFTPWLTSTNEGNVNSSASENFLPSITYPKLWYASLTIGIRFPFGGSNASNESSESTTPAEETTPPSNIGSDGKVALKGRVTDANTGQPVDASMTVVDLTNNQVVATDKTDGDGNYNIRVPAPGKYSVTADADGHLFGTSYFEVDPEGRILSKHPDIKLGEATGRTRLLVFFDFGHSDLNSSSYPELDRAVRLMKAVPTMQVEIAGYTDSVGSADFNVALSQKRANAVRDYLISKGIPKNRVSAKGYGMVSPIADNSTDEGRTENRRVEFVVLSK